MEIKSHKTMSYSLWIIILLVGVQIMSFSMPIISALYIAFQNQCWQFLSELNSYNHFTIH